VCVGRFRLAVKKEHPRSHLHYGYNSISVHVAQAREIVAIFCTRWESAMVRVALFSGQRREPAGYDITDHDKLEHGARLRGIMSVGAQLQGQHGQVLDFVPNHVASPTTVTRGGWTCWKNGPAQAMRIFDID